MNHIKFLLLLLCTSLGAGAAETVDSSSVAACMRANLPTQFAVEHFSLISQDDSGYEEAIGGQIFYRQGSDQGPGNRAGAMMQIQQPAPLRGSAYLIIETDNYLRDGLFVYLPALKRVRRISGEMADGQLFGTDITYYDFALFRHAFKDMDAVEVTAGTVDGRPVHKLVIRPRDATVYDKAIASIDAETCVPRRLKLYQDGRLRKIFSVPLHAIKADGDRWYPAEFTMHDLQSNSRTTFQTLELHTGEALPDALFNPATFYRSR